MHTGLFYLLNLNQTIWSWGVCKFCAFCLALNSLHVQICGAELEELLPRACCIYTREFVREKKYKTEAEAFGWSFVFEDFVSEELKKKVTQKLEVNRNPVMSLVLLFH